MDKMSGQMVKDITSTPTAIEFSTGTCALGTVLVAASDKGVCAILLGGTPAALARDLQARFPNAGLTRGGPDCNKLLAKVIDFVAAPARPIELPLDIRGTAFQRRVWQALRKIPAGKTASYATIARRIGSPAAVRAVAGACAANPIAVAIPCHRVVKSDGGISGYRWGVVRKRQLLQREAAI
jgi:AraC family transcriptional regulator, regulatory protein of adaptative response / methylated-DNA-[protein]-cysteine methyltransferase